jgi:hypothetical protein
LNNGRYRDGYSVLEHATILPFEGQSDVHDLFVQCQAALALELMRQGQYGQAAERLEGAKTYPERLGTGKPADPDFRVQDYLLMLCYKQLGAGPKAAAMKTAIDEYGARNSKEGLDKLQDKLDQWYESEFSKQDELASLKKLAAVIGGAGQGRE